MFLRVTFRFPALIVFFAFPMVVGCGPSDSVVKETEQYSFDNIAAQLAAEEAAAKQDKEK